ncbi:ATP-binding cassette domain-containing protein [bacterium]|nr:ATP-binding cassette domain-containing protein [bacterium]
MRPLIQLNNVTVGYLSETIIQDLSLDIHSGEIIGIFGHNGAGKTTLLCAVNGLAEIFSGNVFIDGVELTKFNGNRLRKNIGYVPQHFEIDPKLPIISKDVILMGRYPKMEFLKRLTQMEKKLFYEVIKLLSLSSIIEKPFGQLSGGEKKKILIGRALMQEPQIMLFDEIFAWLDREMVKNFVDIILQLHKINKQTILLVSHDIDIIKKLCNRVVWMERGNIVMDVDIKQFLSSTKLLNGTN